MLCWFGCINLLLFFVFLKAEIKEKLNEYKKQRAELNEYIEMEQFLLRETEKEIRTREIKAVISNFQERVCF